MSKDVGKILAVLASIVAIIGTCIAAIALIPAFGQWLNPREPVPFTPITNNVSPNTVEASPTVNLQSTNLAIESPTPPIQTFEPTITIQPNNPTEISPTSALSECKTNEINISVNSDNYDGNVIITLEKIEVCANKMKWYISFWNKTSGDAGLAFAEDRSYVVDEFGIQYKILSSSPSNFIDSGVKAGVRLSGWLEFSTPENNAKEFSLYLTQWSFGSNQLKRKAPLTFSLIEPLAQK